jgi:signal transduction histidine kinase
MKNEDGTVIPVSRVDSGLERICRRVTRAHFGSARPSFTDKGSFWTGNTAEPVLLVSGHGPGPGVVSVRVGGPYRSLAVIRFSVTEAVMGLLLLKSECKDFFVEEEVEFYEALAQTLGLAVADRRAEVALQERVKELTCLYGIAQVVEQTRTSLPETLQHIVEFLPPAWQYPDVTAARVTLDGRSYVTRGFHESEHRQSADIVVGGLRRGRVEVVYLEEVPEFSAGAFLSEEEKLIDAVAREISLMVERRESQEERWKLHNQLIHADRLATIGQLAAGVAHELSEPLGGILGFAQLAEKCEGVPPQAREDIGRIITASLYAREVIKKLLVFARQMPQSATPLSLNQVVEEGLSFLEARCTKAGIEVVRELAADLPEINADPARISQVLVNLVVNAIQAMPDGGTLTIGTKAQDGTVLLVVEDTGVGMGEEVMDKIFLPFFTTKDVDKGTGLGLAVVHGIVSSHGGSIAVDSQPGKGSRFAVSLPLTGSRASDNGNRDDNSR